MPLQERYEWWAYYEGADAPPDAVIGVGKTEIEAIADLHRKTKERE